MKTMNEDGRKNDAGGRSLGFTLIELLTVVAIIMILVSLLIPAINGVRKNAQRARAQGDVATLVHALKQYYTDYQQWPTNLAPGFDDKGLNNETSGYIEAGSNLISMLGGQDIRGNNPRLAVFMQLPPQALNAAGEFVDPWGSPYRYMCDYNANGVLELSFTNMPETTVAAWSRGPNRSDSGNKDREDDLASWK